MLFMDIDQRCCTPLKRGVLVLGGAQTKFSVGKRVTKSLRDLAAEATGKAMEKAGCSNDDIDMVVVSNAVGFASLDQGHNNALIATHLDLLGRPSVRVETACAAGAVAIRLGAMAIEAGWANNVLVVGTEVMSGMDRNTTQKVLAGGGDAMLEAPVGATFPGLYASYGMAIINQQASSIEEGQELLRYVAIKNHQNAQYNPYAQFPISLEDLAKFTKCTAYDGSIYGQYRSRNPCVH